MISLFTNKTSHSRENKKKISNKTTKKQNSNYRCVVEGIT